MTEEKLMNLRKKILVYIMICIFFTSTAWGEDNFKNTPLKIGGDDNYPPYEFVDREGNFRGFNVDIIRAIAIEIGLDIQMIPNKWEDTMLSLENGEVDVIQGMTLIPDREDLFDFTEEIIENSQSIFVLSETSYIAGISDLRGKRVAIQAKDVTNEIRKDVEDIIIIEKRDQLEALKALINGEVDAFVGNRLTGIYYIQTFDLTSTVKIVGEPIYNTKYALAVKKGDSELLDLLNTGLVQIKENGTYDKIYKKWFGEMIIDKYKQWTNILYILLSAFLISLVII